MMVHSHHHIHVRVLVEIESTQYLIFFIVSNKIANLYIHAHMYFELFFLS